IHRLLELLAAFDERLARASVRPADAGLLRQRLLRLVHRTGRRRSLVGLGRCLGAALRLVDELLQLVVVDAQKFAHWRGLLFSSSTQPSFRTRMSRRMRSSRTSPSGRLPLSRSSGVLPYRSSARCHAAFRFSSEMGLPCSCCTWPPAGSVLFRFAMRGWMRPCCVEM